MSASERTSSSPDPIPTPVPDANHAEADRLLSSAVEAFATGTGSNAVFWVRAGELCHQYIVFRTQTLGHSRESATAALRGRLAEHADRPGNARPNLLCQVYHAVTLLSGGSSDWITRRVGYTKLRALAPLVQRNSSDETYKLKPDVDADKARELFVDLVGREGHPGLPLKDVERRVGELLGLTPTVNSTPAPVNPERPEPRVAPKTDNHRELAVSVVELVRGSEAPDDVVTEVLTLLAKDSELSKQARRAINAALILLHRNESPSQESPSPAEVATAFEPHTNGHFHHADN